MKRIGLTGNIGSGKSTVAGMFEVLRVPVFYSDEVAKSLYQRTEVKEELRVLFPDIELFRDGVLQKQLLSKIIFSDKVALQKINRLMHPLVEQEFQHWKNSRENCPYVVQESAIIFENNLQDRFNGVIHVAAPLEIRLQRIMDRDHLDRSQAEARMTNQLPEENKRNLADYIIENDGQQLLIPQVMWFHNQFSSI
ncbi:MAG: dephospho-CoA kinase [Bacteroidales bacterium]|jgi:dephospho-CoA kinase